MKVKFVLDKGYPHGETVEIMECDDDTPMSDLHDALHEWVLAQTMCSFEILEEANDV